MDEKLPETQEGGQVTGQVTPEAVSTSVPVEQIPNVPPVVPVAPAPVSPQPIPQTKKSNLVLIVAVVLLILSVLSLAGYFLMRKKAVPTPTPTPVVSPTPTPDVTADWKIYSAPDFSFKYPSEFIVEERDKNFFVIVSEKDKNIAQAGISIDATLTGDLAQYEKAVLKDKENLIDVRTQDLVNGIKISGEIGPGFGEGTSVISAVLKYKNGGLIVEAIISPYADLFDQILPTFKFLETTPSATPTSSPSATLMP